MLSKKEILSLIKGQYTLLDIEENSAYTDYWLETTTEKGETVVFTFVIDDPRSDVGEKETIIVDFFINKYTEELRMKGSLFCLQLQDWIENHSIYADDIKKEKIVVQQGYKVIKDPSFYERYSNEAHIRELTNPLIDFYKATQSKTFPGVQMYEGGDVNDIEWKVKVLGKDGENLAHLLNDLGIAFISEYERRFHQKIVEPCCCLSFYPTDKNLPHQSLSFWVHHLRQLGFCVTSYGVPKEITV